MVEAKPRLFRQTKLLPMLTCALEQHVRAHDVGFDEGAGPVDGPVDMAFRGKMHDGIRAKTLADLPHRARVANVRLLELIARIAGNAGEIIEISGVSQFVDDADFVRTRLDQVAHHRRSDEARAPRDHESSVHKGLTRRRAKQNS